MIDTLQQGLERLEQRLSAVGDGRPAESLLLEQLHTAQEIFGWVPREAMDLISRALQVPTAQVWAVATFYHHFRLKPPGKCPVTVCLGTACYLKGAREVLEAAEMHLGITAGQTTADGFFTLATTRCLGACGHGPTAVIGDRIVGGLTPERLRQELDRQRRKIKRKQT